MILIPPALHSKRYSLLIILTVKYVCDNIILRDYPTHFCKNNASFSLTGNCDFEKGLCTWVNSLNIVEDEFDWRRGSGGTPSRLTGPKTDHTTGTKKGKYIFLLKNPFWKALSRLQSEE